MSRILLLVLAFGAAAPDDTVVVGPGTYAPIYPPSPEEAEIAMPAFRLDRTPVTRGEFAAFVASDPKWRRDRVSRLYADEGYLADWSSPTDPGPLPDRPVVGVSWFAARAYCASRGQRLPTEAEWEFAAAASATSVDARQDPAFVQQLLAWYGEPTPPTLAVVGQREPNLWGAQDLHGLVWEWVEDFDSTLVAGDNREQGGSDSTKFCGAGSLSAADKGDYASFMRIAFRTSLKGSYTTKNLGFRCASDLESP
jgi:sulfatase modifying factor 1